ncbi:MAG: HD domain-containing protein, partial [Epulopiscium sp.]|nr:HD domain-containing protein [Candidatus Epulonipiscium sp.]
MGSRKTIQITDTLHGTINLMPLEKEIISTQIFNRLHNISQNSTVYLTFPANRTKRFEHSIGTMELCGEIYCNALGNADKKTIDQFFYEIHQVISKILDKIMGKNASAYRNIVGDRNLQSKRNLQAILNSIGQDINQSIYSTYSKSIPYNIEEKDVGAYIIVFQAIRISALLHDVGHPPFSHIVESALNEIYQEVIRIDPFSRNNRQKEFIEIMKNYFEDGSQLHERIGHIISDKILDSLMVPLEVSTIPDEDKLSWQLFQVMIKEFVSYIFYEKYPICKNIHAIIDGPLDGDRLDYVARDPINSGLHTGKIEYERLFNSIRLIEFEGDFFFAPATKSIDTIEDFFNRRWDLYKRIIFHHRVIKTDYLLHDCVKELSLRYLEKEVEEEEEEMGILPYDISGIWKAIRHNPSHEVFFDSLIQWDDGWLMTILKKHYFEDFREDTSNDILKFKLEELLANKKYYYSIIKKPED